jgi:DNA topoisomerase-6 subunit B
LARKNQSTSQLALLEPEAPASPSKPAKRAAAAAKGASAGKTPSAEARRKGARAEAESESDDAPPKPPKRGAKGGASGGDSSDRPDARSMAARQREISVSEFFSKNRHLLGFDNPAKALLTTIKEAVDNSLDACEEAGILPDLRVEITELSETRYRVAVQDNGPGIVRQQVPRVFGSLLYGSKFHRLRQSRGQQGIGISAAGMYGQLTTGKPIIITSRISAKKPAHHFEIQIDTKKNMPVVGVDREVDWPVDHGTRVELELEATYKRGRRTVDGYIEQTALANPHARIVYKAPKDPEVVYERASQELPKEPMEIKPHPHGIELGILMRMLKDTTSRNVKGFLTNEFSRVSGKVAEEILALAKIDESASPARVHKESAEKLYNAINTVKIMAPPTNCLSPIGEDQLLSGLRQQYEAVFFTAVSRSPQVYRGNPFLVEVGLAYGVKDMPGDELAELYRFANRVPLLYQQSACAVTKAVVSTAWKSYGVQQSRGALPTGPLVIMVHIASVWVPFTSESKEAIAHYPEIIKEIRLAVQECGRRLGIFIRRGEREAMEAKKRSYIEKYIPHIGIALKEILKLTDKQEKDVVETLRDTLERSRTL